MDQFMKTLSQLAEQLGTKTMTLWPNMVWTYWIGEVISLIVFTVILIAGVIVLKIAYPRAEWTVNDTPKNMPWRITCIVGAALTGLLLLIYLCSLPGTLQAIVSPEATLVLRKLKF